LLWAEWRREVKWVEDQTIRFKFKQSQNDNPHRGDS